MERPMKTGLAGNLLTGSMVLTLVAASHCVAQSDGPPRAVLRNPVVRGEVIQTAAPQSVQGPLLLTSNFGDKAKSPEPSQKKDQSETKPPLQKNPLPHPPETSPVGNGPALGLQDLEALALHHNPTLAQAALLIEAAHGKAWQARLWPNPIVGYIGDQIGQKGTPGEFQGGFVQQEIITAHKRRISSAKYAQQARTAEAEAMLQELKVLNGVRIHYFRLLAIGRLVEIRKGLVGNAAEDYRTTQEEFNIGQKDRAQALLAQNRLAQAEIDLTTEQNRYALLRREVAALIGVRELPSGDITGQLELGAPPLEWDTSLARILQESPEILIAHSHVAFDQLTLERERREPIPNITVRAGVGYNHVEKETVSQIQVQMPIPIWNRNQGNIRQVQADLARSREDIRRTELQLQKRLAHHFDKYQDALVLVKTFQKINVPNSFQAYEVYLDQYKQRRIPWPEVVRMHRTWLNTRMTYVENLLRLREEETTIMGLLAVDGLTAPTGPPPRGHLEVSPQPR
jgi:cobalt-zinc-cadmium efflux system outer membrane protein